jgi:hypothetical protein
MTATKREIEQYIPALSGMAREIGENPDNECQMLALMLFAAIGSSRAGGQFLSSHAQKTEAIVKEIRGQLLDLKADPLQGQNEGGTNG